MKNDCQADATPADVDRATYTVRETAAKLGLGFNQTYQAIRRGEIPALRIGGRILIPRLALERLLEDAAA